MIYFILFLHFIKRKIIPPGTVGTCACLSHGGRDPHRAWATSSWMLDCTGLASRADRLLVNLLPSSQQSLSHCNTIESLLAFLASRRQTQPNYNKNFFLFFFCFSSLFRSTSPSIVFPPLNPPLSSRCPPSFPLSLVASLQGGYAAYRYAQPAAVATPAAAAAAAAAYSDRWDTRAITHLP